MRSDAAIMRDGFQALSEKLDIVERAKFISLISREKFDYTAWRQALYEELPLEEIHRRASQFSEKLRNKQ